MKNSHIVALLIAITVAIISAPTISSATLTKPNAQKTALLNQLDLPNSQKQQLLNASQEKNKPSTPESSAKQSVKDIPPPPPSSIEEAFSKWGSPGQQVGYTVFSNNDSAPYSNIAAGPDYILAPGDQLNIQIWGKVEEQFSVAIENNGQISLPKVGPIQFSGVRYGSAASIIKRELSKYYTNFDVNVTLAQLRSNQIFVLGSVQKPGAYEVSAMSTLIMALYSSGGPTKMGSLRKVQLIRNRRTIKTIDLYSYLLAGDKSQDPLLQNFDTIFVPVIGDVVNITGLVKQPGIYEIKNKTTLYDVIDTYAGGFNLGYYGKRIRLERIVEGKKLAITDIELSDKKQAQSQLRQVLIKNGDTVHVLAIPEKRYNEVYIQGSIQRPGTYALDKGMTLQSLIQKADNFLDDAFTARIEISREVAGKKELILLNYEHSKDRDFPILEFDTILIFSKRGLFGEKSVTITGAVNRGGSIPLYDNMRLLDLVQYAQPQKSALLDRAELIRKTASGNVYTTAINLERLQRTPSSNENFLIQDQDQIIIRQNPYQTVVLRVDLIGEAQYPGSYIIQPGDTLKSLITRAGGLTPKSFLPGLILKRKSIQVLEEEGQKRILREERKRLFFDSERIKSLSGADYNSSYGSALDLISSQATQNAGRLTLNINEPQDLDSPANNIVLENGDIITIPETPGSVQIVGGVQQGSAHLFIPNLRTHDYIQLCGGFNDFARQESIYTIKPNGAVLRNSSGMVGRGDTIYIPEEIKTRFDLMGAISTGLKYLVDSLTIVALIKVLI